MRRIWTVNYSKLSIIGLTVSNYANYQKNMYKIVLEIFLNLKAHFHLKISHENISQLSFSLPRWEVKQRVN